LPAILQPSRLRRASDPENFPLEPYVVAGGENYTTLVLPRLPVRLRLVPDAALAMYDHVAQRSIPLRTDEDGWCASPRVSPGRFGYLLQIDQPVDRLETLHLEGTRNSFDALLSTMPEDAQAAREWGAMQQHVAHLLQLVDDVDAKRSTAEARLGELLELNETLEAKRAASEARIDELLRLSAELEQGRSAAETRVDGLLGQNLALERARVSEEERIEALLRHAQELEGKRVALEAKVSVLLDQNAALEAARSAGEARIEALLQHAEELETQRAAAEALLAGRR
jgi:hypothetical protein